MPDSEDSVSIASTVEAGLGRVWRLQATQVLDHPVEDVFPFFADAHNLEEITPRS